MLAARTFLKVFTTFVVASRRSIIAIEIIAGVSFGSFRLLLPNSMDPGARIDAIIYGPIGAFATVSERARDFFETWIQG